MVNRLKRHLLNLGAKDAASVNWSWQSCRKAYLALHGKICQCCGYTKHIQVHHVKPRHLFPELALVSKNLIGLCRDCHFHIGHLNNYKSYNSAIETVAKSIRNESIRKSKLVT